MRIEKLNDNQIRCTLTRDDLANRQIKLSELAYGTEKAKELFRDMMQQAAVEFGFEADNIPLMIEAIPLPNECIVLIITKVEDPEELDTRFSKFAPGGEAVNDEAGDLNGILPEGADNVLDIFRKLLDRHLKDTERKNRMKKPSLWLRSLTLPVCIISRIWIRSSWRPMFCRVITGDTIPSTAWPRTEATAWLYGKAVTPRKNSTRFPTFFRSMEQAGNTLPPGKHTWMNTRRL